MKHKILSLIALSSLCFVLWQGAALRVDAAPLGVSVGIEVFQTSLAPYGRWFQHEKYGLVWTPTRVDVRWRPYTVGNWVYTDYGWTWNSAEDWGWATYHYGRWNFDSGIGWVWVPGYDWSPAWVSWRNGNGMLGWAPLSPEIVWENGAFGIEVGMFDKYIPPFSYSFVEERYFTAPHLATYIALTPRNVVLLRQTSNITRYQFANQHLVNNAIDVQRIERITGQSVQRIRLEEASSLSAQGRWQVGSQALSLYRPNIVRGKSSFTDENLQRQVEERQALQQRQQRDREQTSQRQQLELNGASHGNLSQQHAEEQRELEQQHQREAQLLNNRHAAGHVGGNVLAPTKPERRR